MENLRIEDGGRILTVRVAGEITIDVTDDVRREVSGRIDSRTCVVAMDLSRVTFMDSSGIGLLIALTSQARNQERRFVILAPSPQVRKTLALVQLTDYFEICEDEASLSSEEDS